MTVPECRLVQVLLNDITRLAFVEGLWFLLNSPSCVIQQAPNFVDRCRFRMRVELSCVNLLFLAQKLFIFFLMLLRRHVYLLFHLLEVV